MYKNSGGKMEDTKINKINNESKRQELGNSGSASPKLPKVAETAFFLKKKEWDDDYIYLHYILPIPLQVAIEEYGEASTIVKACIGIGDLTSNIEVINLGALHPDHRNEISECIAYAIKDVLITLFKVLSKSDATKISTILGDIPVSSLEKGLEYLYKKEVRKENGD
jgi:hypothetical protein